MSQTPHLPLLNHLIKVRSADADTTLLPLARSAHHFQHLHAKYLHEVDGEECYEVPLDLVATLVNKHKGNFAKLTMLLDVLANRGIGHNMKAIKAGSTDPKEMFWQDYEDAENTVPAQSFVVTAEGKTILPLCLHTVATLYGLHHSESENGIHRHIPSRGGNASLDAIEAMDELLKEIGLEPNHTFIRQKYCATCGGYGSSKPS